MRDCSREEYAAAIDAAGGIDNLTPLSTYTCVDGDEFTYGRKIETTWGTRDGVPICASMCRNDDARAERSMDVWSYEIWVQP